MHARAQKVITLYLFDSSQCKAIFHNTYYWKLQHILRHIPLLILLYRHHEFHAVAKYPI